MMNETIPNRPILTIKAKLRPIFLAFFFSSSGNLSDIIDIKIILSIPKTISKKVKITPF